MKTFKKVIATALTLIMILSVVPIAANAETLGTITVTSNIADDATVEYTDAQNQVKIVYNLQLEKYLVNAQGTISYDSSVLKVADIDPERCLPALTDGTQVFNTRDEGTIYFNVSKGDENLYDSFGSSEPFIVLTFDIIGSGDTTVALDVDVLTVNWPYDSQTGVYPTRDTDERLVWYDNEQLSGFEASSTVQAYNKFADVAFKTLSLSLKGEIGVNFYVNISDQLKATDGSDIYVRFTGTPYSEPFDVSLADAKAHSTNSTWYGFTAPVSATEMTRPITATVYSGDTAVKSITRSVKDYAAWAITQSDTKLVNLATAMVDYGGKAQLNFNKYTDDLANSILTNYTPAEVVRDNIEAHLSYDNQYSAFGLKLSGVTAVTWASTAIRIKFTILDQTALDNSSFTFAGNDVELIPDDEEGKYYFELKNIYANNLNAPYSLVMTNTNGDTNTITYAVTDYVRSVLRNSDDTNLINLSKALYLYNRAAIAYFA